MIASMILDIFSIIFNWAFGYSVLTFRFFISLVIAILLIIFKGFIFVYQFQIAKKLNGEQELNVKLPKGLESGDLPSNATRNNE
jgi:hypothetical protein